MEIYLPFKGAKHRFRLRGMAKATYAVRGAGKERRKSDETRKPEHHRDGIDGDASDARNVGSYM